MAKVARAATVRRALTTRFLEAMGVQVAPVARAGLARATAVMVAMVAMVAMRMVGRFLVWEALVGRPALVGQVARAAAQAKPGPQAKRTQPKAHSRAPRMHFVGIRFLRVVRSEVSGLSISAS